MTYKLNTHRFDDTIRKNVVVDAKTTGVDKATQDLIKMGNSISNLNDKALNFNPSSITSGIDKITQFQKLLVALGNTKVNINDIISGSSGGAVFNALPKNIKSMISSLGEVQSQMGKDAGIQNYAHLANKLEDVKSVLVNLNKELQNTDSIMKTLATDSEETSSKMKNALSIAADSFDNGKQYKADGRRRPKPIAVTASRTPTAALIPTTAPVATDIDKLSDSGEKASGVFDNLKEYVKKFNDSLNNTPNLIDKVNKSFKGLDAVKLVYLYRTIKRSTTALINAVDSAAAYEESINLYKMALGKYADDATVWANKIGDKLMLDKNDIMQYTGAFFNLARGMGVTNDAAYLMSRNLTQLTYDMSSYLNISVSAAQAKLQSAMAGQSRAVASVGVATQVASLQELAYSMGVKKRVAEMTQAEKTYLRYIQLMRSTSHMQGDLGKTMNTPANAVRILKTQIEMLGRAFGQVLMPTLQAVLPYILAVTNVLKKAAEALAGFFGYKFTDVDTTTTSFEILEDGLDGVADTAEGAAKKVKNSLAPFDDLNVVMSSTSGSGKGGKVTEDVSSKFAENLPSYDMLSKYTDTFKKKAEELEDAVKPFLWMAAGSVIYNALKKIWTFMRTKLFASGIFSSVKTLASLFKDDLGGGISGLGGALSESYSMWHNNLTVMDKIKNTLLGAAGVVIGVTLLNDGLSKFNGEATSVIAYLENIAGSLLGIGGTFLILSNYINDLKKTLIVTGLLTTLGEMIVLAKDYTDTMNTRREFLAGFEQYHIYSTQYLEDFKELNEAYNKLTTVGSSHNEKLFGELQDLVDANGKVKEGYEERVQFIVTTLSDAYGIEMELEDGIIKKYQDKVDEIKKAIKVQKDEAKLSIYKDYYHKALEKEIELQALIVEIQGDIYEAEKRGDKQVAENARKRLERVKNDYTKNKDMINSYEKILEGSIANNEKTVSEGMLNMEKSIAGLKRGSEVSLSTMLESSNTIFGALVDQGNASYDEIKTAMNEAYGTVINYMVEQSKGIDKMSPDLQMKWHDLASNSRLAYVEALSKMNPEDQKKINDMLGDTSVEAINYAKQYAKDHGGKLDLSIIPTYSNSYLIDKIKKMRNSIVASLNKITIPVHFTTESGVQHSGGTVNKRASGGFPDKGELFLMNEAGPEFIGSIGGKTAVTNQDQMVKAVSNAISVGLQNMGANTTQPQTIVVQIGNDKIYEGQGTYQSRQTDRYGTNYIKI